MAALTTRGLAAGRWPYRIAALLTLGAFNLITFNRYFPLSEGWWETYGYLYNAGLRPYRDFDLAFTPLFTLINAGLLQVFGDSFFALRLFGVLVFLASVLALELLLEEFFSARTAAVAVTVSAFFVIFEHQFIAKDYHFYQLGLTALCLLLHVRLAASTELSAGRRLAGTVLLGVGACLVFVLKQNVGALLVAAIGASLPFVERERRVARVLAYAGGVALLLVLMLPIVSPSDWRQLLLGNDAKGSLDTVLLRFWRDRGLREGIYTAARMAAAIAVVRFGLAAPSRWTGVWSDSLLALRRRPLVGGAVFVLALGVVAVNGNFARHFLSDWLIPVTLAILIVTFFRVAYGLVDRARAADARWVAVILPLVAQAYSNTTTAWFDFVGLQVPVAFAIGWVLAALESWASVRYWAVAALAFLIAVPEIFAHRLRVPYQWGGHRPGPVLAATERAEYPQLRGMRVTPEYRDVLDAIKHDVDTYSRSDRDVFFFSLPVFYWFHGKRPPFRTVVQWFDVVTSKQMDADLQAMKEQPPRLIVALEPPPYAYRIHGYLKQSPRQPQADFRDLMDEWVASRKYRLVRSIALPNDKHLGKEIIQSVVVQAERSVGTSFDAVRAEAEAAGLAVAREGAAAAAPVRAGEVLAVRGEYPRVRSFSTTLGVPRGEPRDYNVVNVYVREDALTTASR